ncbi:MAG: hypothetical protein M1820_002381 [Bogoriella megaspora]|nr:MAG: hypothetical protein M1820_002381 [Bogoriella megaspora]
MTVAYDTSYRSWTHGTHGAVCLEDKFEVLKEIGDGSFGSVELARVRSAGSHIARRGTLVAVKTMKKQFESFQHCLELREVIFMRSLPAHHHLVPALDIFLDPLSKKLHIVMEYMDGNLYQLMKAREHKRLDPGSVKSILFQILAGLEHIHEHSFFHRDIKPENILVSTSAPQENAFKRYSSLVTPPSTPPAYTIKIADFGLARETHSKMPYTTYVSTRWYRAPEVLLRAGEYSAPVDIWAIGAMAVEIATLKPLFPGGNEVDQVWRVCEIMGSPGSWVNKHGNRVGGGEWKEGIKLAQKLGFSFPKMAPHSMDSILQTPEWPASLASFVTWCLMWDPKSRPTSTQALRHEYFTDAYDPMRPKSNSSSRLLGRKQSGVDKEGEHALSSKGSSWFRRSLVARESAPAVPQHIPNHQPLSPEASPVQENHANAASQTVQVKQSRPNVTKRSTWTNGVPNNGAPIPILPSIKPISPLSDAVHAQAQSRPPARDENPSQKIGRQLSVASHGNHYADLHRQEAERALNGQSGLASPPNGQKESFFSHLRKRARRFSGRHQAPMSPGAEDIEANAGCAPWATSNRTSMTLDPPAIANAPSNAPSSNTDLSGFDLDKALQNVRYSLDGTASIQPPSNEDKTPTRVASNPMLKRHHSLGSEARVKDGTTGSSGQAPISARTRRALQRSTQPMQRYETPDEEDELLDEALHSARKAANGLDHQPYLKSKNAHGSRPPINQSSTDPGYTVPYLTPSPSAKRNGINFGSDPIITPTQPLDIMQPRQKNEQPTSNWPTPPYDDNDWAAAASASIFAAQTAYR